MVRNGASCPLCLRTVTHVRFSLFVIVFLKTTLLSYQTVVTANRSLRPRSTRGVFDMETIMLKVNDKGYFLYQCSPQHTRDPFG